MSRRPSAAPATRRSKYGAIRCDYDGHKFASKREMRVYQDLKLREKAGEIHSLTLQPRYDLFVDGVKICAYVADFGFHEGSPTHSRHVLADAKGVVTPVYRIKRALMKAIHGIDILEL